MVKWRSRNHRMSKCRASVAGFGLPGQPKLCLGAHETVSKHFGGRAKHDEVVTAGKRGGNNLNHFEYFRIEKGSSERQNLALTGLSVQSSLDSDMRKQSTFKIFCSCFLDGCCVVKLSRG